MQARPDFLSAAFTIEGSRDSLKNIGKVYAGKASDESIGVTGVG